MKQIALLVTLVVTMSGCFEQQYSDIEVVTEPPGSVIEVDDGYAGVSPCTIQVPSEDGYFYQKITTIVALPVAEGGHSQVKMFRGGSRLTRWNNVVPKKIYFNMHMKSIPSPSLDVNLY